MREGQKKDRKPSACRHRNVLDRDVEKNLWLLFHVQIMLEDESEVRRNHAEKELKKNCSEEEIRILMADFRGIDDLDRYMERIKQIVSLRLELH
jgi:hypothetical protein